jgi:hypothetical protein
MLANLLKREAYFQIHGLRRSGPSRTDYGDGWQIYHGDFPASLPEAPGMCWANPEKKNPALSRREEEPNGWRCHAPSGLNSGNLAMLQLIDPPPLVAYGKALEGALDAQTALVLVIVGLECGQAVRGEGRIRSEANRARLVQMHVRFKCTYMNSAPISKPLSGVQTRLVPIRASLRFETPTAPPKPASARAG